MNQRAPTAGKPRARSRKAEREGPELLAFDLLLRTASQLDQQVARLLKPAAVTPAQYNVLRILRSAGEAGQPCREISNRLVRHDPDVTRLLDRLEALGFVARSRDLDDRRVVIARITPAGRRLLDEIGPSITALHVAQFQSLSKTGFHQLQDLLRQLRGADQ